MGEIERMRALSDLTRPDPRHEGGEDLLASLHGTLTAVRLNNATPNDVLQLFETAKTLSLYSWFVYRFHPVARLVGYACLEAALRPLALNDPCFPANLRRGGRPALKDMLKHAVERNWLRNEGFDNARHIAGVRAKQKSILRQIEEMSALGLDQAQIQEPGTDEIAAELAASTYVQGLSESIPVVRNHLAHGGRFLDSGSVAILKVVAEAINQLYPDSSERGESC
jgi:hypothetical protein